MWPDSDLATLVKASVAGDEDAWNELVRRHVRLVVAVTRHHRLSTSDAQDVTQTVWLRLVEHLAEIREPAALPGWIVTTARHECLRLLRAGGRTVVVDPVDLTVAHPVGDGGGAGVEATLIAAERHQVLLDGLAELSPHQRRLLTLLAADPPPPYAEISRMLGIPIGSIGPTRSRILERLRSSAAVRGYMKTGADAAQTGGGRHASAELE
jgi:RNA polymerase sigma factor (sigma-70 family)